MSLIITNSLSPPFIIIHTIIFTALYSNYHPTSFCTRRHCLCAIQYICMYMYFGTSSGVQTLKLLMLRLLNKNVKKKKRERGGQRERERETREIEV